LTTGLLTLALPGGLLAVATVAVDLPWVSPEQLESFLTVYRWVVLVLGLLLGVRFRHGRAVFALVALAVASRVLGALPGGAVHPEAARFAFAATALLLPANLVWLAVARERGTLTASGVRRLTVLAAQPAMASFLWLSYHPGLADVLERPFLKGVPFLSARLPYPSVVAFGLALLVTAVAWLGTRSFLEAAFFWAVVASLAGLLTTGPATQTYLATAGLFIVIALVESTFAMAYRDPLTGLPGRRAFDEALSKLSGRYAIAMVDIDHFKAVNDRYGHDVGDQVLRMLAARTADLSGARAFRFGGEEFALVFPGMSRDGAVEQLDAWRAAIAKVDFALRGKDRPRRKPKQVESRPTGTATLRLTVSIGVAEAGGRLLEPGAVVGSADEALYRAKRAGRNQVRT
jgi:diguanylate cyclase (GGDEF)-like protein